MPKDIETCRRLHKIKPDEHIVYYRGHFDGDITRSGEVTEYAHILHEIRRTAIKLELIGVVRLYELCASVSLAARKGIGPAPVVEYCAVGLPETGASDGSTAEESAELC